MDWSDFFTVIAGICAIGTMFLAMGYVDATYERPTKLHRNWSIGLFIITVISGALAGGLR